MLIVRDSRLGYFFFNLDHMFREMRHALLLLLRMRPKETGSQPNGAEFWFVLFCSVFLLLTFLSLVF